MNPVGTSKRLQRSKGILYQDADLVETSFPIIFDFMSERCTNTSRRRSSSIGIKPEALLLVEPFALPLVLPLPLISKPPRLRLVYTSVDFLLIFRR